MCVLKLNKPSLCVCLLALSLWLIGIHTYTHLKHEHGDKWYKNRGWTITYIKNVYTRHV